MTPQQFDTVSDVMPSRCALCSSRLRKDGTCSSQTCKLFRKPERGSHWRQTRFHQAQNGGLGQLAGHVGAFVAGGFILTLNHRHDIRVAIASGMFLKTFLLNTPLRLEVLFLISPCYWKWSTGMLLGSVVARYFEWATADPVARADMWQSAWNSMAGAMSDMQVVVDTENFGVACLSRSRRRSGRFSPCRRHLRLRRWRRRCRRRHLSLRRGLRSSHRVSHLLRHCSVGVVIVLVDNCLRRR